MLGALISVLLRHERRVVLAGVVFISAAVNMLEVVVLALVLPILLLIAGGAGQIDALPEGLQALIDPVVESASLALLSGILVAVIVLKNVALTAIFAWQTRVAARGASALTTELIASYLAAPLEYHLKRRNAQYLRGLRDVPEVIWFRGGLSLCNLVAEAAGIAALALALAVVEPLGVGLAVLFLGALVGLNHRIMGGYFQRWGNRYGELIRRLYQLGGQVFANIKLVRASAAEAAMAERLETTRRSSMEIEAYRRFAQLSIRPVSEIAMLIAAGIIMAVALHDATTAAEALPLLAVFGFGAVRLLPAINRISGHVNELKFVRPVVAEYEEELAALDAHPPVANHAATLRFKHQLQFQGLRYQYPDAARSALDGVSLTLNAGETVGIAGASGAGKSTLVDIVLGLLIPDAGTVLTDGGPAAFLNEATDVGPIDALGRGVGYAAQGSPVIDATIRENIAFGIAPEKIDAEQLRAAVEAAQLSETVAALPKGLDTEIGESGVRLSGGQRQRIALARALYGQPSLIVLDEATSGLDMSTEAEVSAAVDRLHGRCTILIVAHRLHLLKRCDRVLFMQEGRILAEGTFDTLAATTPSFRQMIEAAEGGERSGTAF
ncbi:MAG: ABC transporter ATP-binding protein [Pseudomonadota bacterium]